MDVDTGRLGHVAPHRRVLRPARRRHRPRRQLDHLGCRRRAPRRQHGADPERDRADGGPVRQLVLGRPDDVSPRPRPTAAAACPRSRSPSAPTRAPTARRASGRRSAPTRARRTPPPGRSRRDGNRALRVVATDAVGRTTTTIRNVTVDRTAPAATLDDPGANLRGTVSLSADGDRRGRHRRQLRSASSARRPARTRGRRSRPTSPRRTRRRSTPPAVVDGHTTSASSSPTSRATRRSHTSPTASSTTPPGRLDDEPGRERARHGRPHLDRVRRGLGRRLRHLPVLGGRPGRLARDLGPVEHVGAHRRALRPARDRDRQRRQLDGRPRRSRTCASTTRPRPRRWATPARTSATLSG